MKKLLITGFDPFGGESVNPAYEAVRLLPDVVAEIKLCKLEVPTEFVRSGAVLRDALAAERPDAVLCVGQAGGRAAITPERVAINQIDSRIPHNAGYHRHDPHDSPGRTPAQPLLYTLLHTAAVEYPGMPGGFIHVPYALEQLPGKPEGTPGLALQQITRGLSCAIEAIAEAWT